MSIVFELYTEVDLDGTFALALKKPTARFVQTGEVFELSMFMPSFTGSVAIDGSFSLPLQRQTARFVQTGEAFELTQPRAQFYGSQFVPTVLNSAMLAMYRPFFSGVETLGITADFTLDIKKPAPRLNQTGEVLLLDQHRFGFSGTDRDPLTGGIFYATQSPGYVSMLAGDGIAQLASSLKMGMSSLQHLVYLLTSKLSLHDEAFDLIHALEHLTSGLDVTDQLTLIFKALLSSGFTLEGDVAAHYQLLARLADTLSLIAGQTGKINAHMVIASAIALADAVTMITKGSLHSTMDIRAALVPLVKARYESVVNAVFTATQSDHIRFFALLSDEIDIGSSQSTLLTALLKLSDEFGVSAAIRFKDTVYYGWAVNTRNKAFSEYHNFPFNSFCEYNGRYFGATDTGIYELTGADDAGTDISSYIRLGLSTLGVDRLKRMPAMYIGYASSGQLVLQVITTSPDGNKTTNYYELQPQTANVTKEGRVKIGKGIESTYFDFVLSNTNGSTLSLDSIEFYPIILDRRIRRP